jgi:hypothetical protein
MNIQGAIRPAAILALISITTLAGCASGSSTPLGQNAGLEIETVPASLEGTIDSPYGGSSDGVTFKIKGSSPSDVYYWTVLDDDSVDKDPDKLTLPPGLTRFPDDPIIPTVFASNTLIIRGTPTKCGSYPINIVVHNYSQHQQILAHTDAIEIRGAQCPPPTISSSSFVFFQDFENERRLGVENGTPRFTWQALSNLPDGISLDAQTGILSGRPTTSGISQVIFRVTDSEFRVHEKEITLEVKVVTAEDFVGTWSGVLTKGFLVTPGNPPTFTNITGQRLSLLFQLPVPVQQVLVSAVDQGTLGDILLPGNGASALQFSLQPGQYSGLFNGAIATLRWHLGCDPLPSGQLECIGHSIDGPQYDADVVLTRLSTATEDIVAPQIQSSTPTDGQQNVQSFEVSVTFSEPMSSSASVSLSGGAGSVGPPAFVTNDPTTVKIPLIGIQENTIYTLTLNPSGQNGFKDVAGNVLAQDSIQFTTGALIPVTLSVSLDGTGKGTVASTPPGITCGSSSAACSADFSTGRIVTLTAAPDDTASEFTGWSDPACPGTGTCLLTMNASRTVGARFEPIPKFTLTVVKEGNGSGTVFSDDVDALISCSPQCAGDYQRDTIVMLQAEPNTASSGFSSWGGACAGVTGATCSVTVDGAKSVTATFTLLTRTLSVTKAGTGTGTVSSNPVGITSCAATCSAPFNHGAVVTLTASEGSGSTFTGWSNGCTGTAIFCSVTMDAAKSVTATFTLQGHALSVTKAGTGNGTVSSSPLGINSCAAACSANFSFGTDVTLTADPAGDSTFTGWSGGGCTGTETCTVTMDSDKSVTATFAVKTYTLTVTKSGSGSGTVSSNPAGINSCSTTCSATFSHGTPVTLTPAAGSGSVFTSWGVDCSGTDPCQVSMTADRSVTAAFGLQATFPLTVTMSGNGSGSVVSDPSGITCPGSCTGNFAQNVPVTLTPTVGSGSTFTGWSGPGISCPGTGSCTVPMDSAESVTATFTLNSYALTVAKTGSGTGTVTSSPAGINCGGTCSSSYNHGTQVVLTAAPTSGATFAGWSGPGVSCPGTGTCTVTVTAATTVTATFTTVTYTLTVATNGGTGTGVVTSNPAGINCGTACAFNFNPGTVVLTATPDAGATFTGWSGTGISCPGTGTCSVTMDAAKSVTATFTAGQTFNLTVTRAGSGTGTVTSNPAGITCGSDCSEAYASGTNVALTATASSGSTFTGWGGGCSGSGSCTVAMSAAQSVTATFGATSTEVRADPQSFTIRLRQPVGCCLNDNQYAITLTGSSPNPGPLTFRITRFPTYQDPTVTPLTQPMGMILSRYYMFVDPVTGVKTKDQAANRYSTPSTIAMPPGDGTVTGSPVVVYTPKTCHTIFWSDSFEFVAIDSLGNVSPPATVLMTIPEAICNHG